MQSAILSNLSLTKGFLLFDFFVKIIHSKVTFLIANKNAEDFKLLIESVTLE